MLFAPPPILITESIKLFAYLYRYGVIPSMSFLRKQESKTDRDLNARFRGHDGLGFVQSI